MNNCLFYAIGKFFKNGGFIVIGKSKRINWVHFSWTPNFKEFYHYVPIKGNLKLPWASKILFKGKEEMKKVETFGNEQKVPKKYEVPVRKVCHICHGMGVKEKPNGDTFDCPNRSCNNGYIIIKNK